MDVDRKCRVIIPEEAFSRISTAGEDRRRPALGQGPQRAPGRLGPSGRLALWDPRWM